MRIADDENWIAALVEQLQTHSDPANPRRSFARIEIEPASQAHTVAVVAELVRLLHQKGYRIINVVVTTKHLSICVEQESREDKHTS